MSAFDLWQRAQHFERLAATANDVVRKLEAFLSQKRSTEATRSGLVVSMIAVEDLRDELVDLENETLIAHDRLREAERAARLLATTLPPAASSARATHRQQDGPHVPTPEDALFLCGLCGEKHLGRCRDQEPSAR